jgi:hypothetical protein
VIERYDTPGDVQFLRVMVDCVEKCAKMEGLLAKPLKPKEKKEPKQHLHLHAKAPDDLLHNASAEHIIEMKSLVARLRKNGSNGEAAKVIDVEENGKGGDEEEAATDG